MNLFKKYWHSKAAMLFLVLTLLFNGTTTYTNNGTTTYTNIDYLYAFDQQTIYEQYKSCMHALGCYENLFPDHTDDIIALQDQQHIVKQHNRYRQSCLWQLEKARRWAITETARENLSLIALIGAASLATIRIAEKDSYGGSISIFASFINSAYLLKDVIRAGYQLTSKESHPLTELEEFFAQNKCFIPHVLWPTITAKFTLARQNHFEQLKTINFLTFALGLTYYQKPVSVDISDEIIERVIAEMNSRIDAFFARYQDDSDQNYHQLLKINVAKFIYALAGSRDISPRYIYLHGPGGIGKTYFVRTLVSWIEELLPNAVNFNNLVITTAQELEGDQETPGAMLRILRNQLTGKKHGSIVFLDEADWINKEAMTSCAKRIFNDNQSEISTYYFGSGLDGTGIRLMVRPTLIFLAGNTPIEDPALASRFDIITFPTPTEHLLIDHAIEKIKKSAFFTTQQHISRDIVEQWIRDNNVHNFRFIDSHIEQYMMNQVQVD